MNAMKRDVRRSAKYEARLAVEKHLGIYANLMITGNLNTAERILSVLVDP
jgi:hypothetical protein